MSIRRRSSSFQFTDTRYVLKMLLSIVVNLLSSINGTRSAPQAASPLVSIMVAEHSSLDSSS